MDYSRILPRLFVGSCPISPEDVDRLRASGITAVLNLQTEGDFAYWAIDWPQLEAHYRKAGLEVRRVPIEDFNPEALRENLGNAVEALEGLINDGHTVLVHCSAGINRSPSTIIAYLHWVEGRDLMDAVRHVIGCRSCDPYVEAIVLATADRAREKEGR